MQMPNAPESNHGFNLIGERAPLLSHIPMFMAPHQAQLFMEVSLSNGDGTDALKTYLADRKKTGATAYVLVSDPLVLPTLAPDAPRPLRSFTGKLYRGPWPFDNLAAAPVVIPALTVTVARSIFFRSFIHAPALSALSYYCFSTRERTYLAHAISRPPDFNQLLTVKASGHDVGEKRGVVELQFPGVANSIPDKLTPHRKAAAVIAQSDRRIKLEIGDQLVYDDDPKHLGETM